MPPPSIEPPWPAAPLRIVRWLILALPVDVTRKPRYLKLPSMIVVRAFAPLTVMSDWITRSLLMSISPAGTLMMSAISLVASEAAIAERRLGQLCVSVLQPVPASPVPVTCQVSACAGEATASAASPAMNTARTRTRRH